jgi:hypothetical protein
MDGHRRSHPRLPHSTSAAALPPRGLVQDSRPIARGPSTAPAATRQFTARSPDPAISIALGRSIAPETCHSTFCVTDGGADGWMWRSLFAPLSTQRCLRRLNPMYQGGSGPKSFSACSSRAYQAAGSVGTGGGEVGVGAGPHDVASRTTKTTELTTTMHLLR